MAALNQDEGNYALALSLLDPLIAQHPDCAEAYCLKGSTLQFMGVNREDFMPYYDSAIKLKPDFADAYILRGLSKQGGDALSDVEMAFKLNPELPDAHYARGLVRSVIGDHFEAIADFDKAIELKIPNVNRVYSNRVNMKLFVLDYQDAYEHLHKAIDIDSLDALNYYNRCKYYRATQKTRSYLEGLSKGRSNWI